MMKPHPLDSQDDEQKLFTLVAEYQAELDAGRQPDKACYLNRYPDRTGYLAEILRVCDMVTTPVLSASTLQGVAKSTVKSLPSLGDYHLEREIGSGGMGIIYEATQLSLNRKVALKLMRPAPVVNERSKKRFVNEAHAAATLQHPHIVSVYACGIEADTPYYAMQYIEGISISRLIHQLRHTIQEPEATTARLMKCENSAVIEKILKLVPPLFSPEYFHWVARLIVQATSGLQYAHECGIIHRDIKPGNILIDAQGKLWITDFGLAHLPDSDMTVTSETLGTPRYMSPEQLNQPRAVVDQRTDLYSLGITLYELLTLQPAFGQETRQQLSQAILQNEPVSPRKLVQSLPLDLQVITCKAIAKEPAERYHSAQQFGAELQRFLEDRPILARPPSLVRRGRHWARRNPLIVGVSLLSLGLVLLGCILLLWRENAWNERIVADQTQAIRKQDKLQSLVRSNLQLALNMLDEYFLSEEENRLLTEGIPQARKKEAIQQSIRLYEQLAKTNDNDPVAVQMHGQAFRRLGALRLELGQTTEAELELRQAVAVLQQQVKAQPYEERLQAELVECRLALARALWMNKKSAASQEQFTLAKNEISSLTRLDTAKSQHVLIHANVLVNMSISVKPEEQLALKEQALALLEKQFGKEPDHTNLRINLAFTYNEVAKSYLARAQHDQVTELSRKAVKLLDVMGEEYRNWRWQILYARCHSTLALGLRQIKQQADAQISFEKALTALNSIKHYANVTEVQSAIALNQEGLGRLIFAQKDYDRAIACFHDAEKNYLTLISKQPDYIYWRRCAAAIQYLLSNSYRKQGLERETIAALERAVVNDPEQTMLQSKLAWHLAVARDDKLRDGRRAVELALRSLPKNEGDSNYQLRLAAAYIANGEWENAIQAAELSIKQRQKPTLINFALLARALHGRGDNAMARSMLSKALELKNDVTEYDEPDKKLVFQEICDIVLGNPRR